MYLNFKSLPLYKTTKEKSLAGVWGLFRYFFPPPASQVATVSWVARWCICSPYHGGSTGLALLWMHTTHFFF